jgi:hypothetical protein
VQDFEATYKLVHEEAPVFAHWRVDPEDEALLSIDLSTSDEPLGEGAPDRSP